MTTQGGIVGHHTELGSLPTKEVELIKTYRRLALASEIDWALNEIKNEVFIFDVPDKKAVDISFSESEENNLSDSLMKKIRAEYDYLYCLLNFDREGLDLFARWYIDGRLFLQKVVDENKLKEGIQEIVYIDSLKIKKVVEYPQPDKDGCYDLTQVKLYYIFSDVHDVYNVSKTTNVKVINKNSIAYSDSGLYDDKTGQALSHLYKVIVPYNNMKMMEEALLVYRVVRSPERRVFYINVGSLSKSKAEQYIRELMMKFKNKLVYDSSSGTLVDRKNVMSMVEDYWLPRRDDGKGTEIQTLPGAQQLGETGDVDYFNNKFQQSTNVPVSRFREEQNPFGYSRNAELTRDEYRFKKFLDRLRNCFIVVFEDLLKTQLILKKVIVDSDWEDIKQSLVWVYAEDNNFVEFKEAEILSGQLETLERMDQFVGKYFTKEYALKTAMKMSDDVIEKMLDDVEEEGEEPEPNNNPGFDVPTNTDNSELDEPEQPEKPPVENDNDSDN